MGRQDKKMALDPSGTSGARMQYGALCWRRLAGVVEVLLITSRDTGRWIIPKGWPMLGLAPEAAAAQEAWEEAGVEGTLNPVCLGRFGYHKALSVDATVPCAVAVYGLQVRRLADKFPEMNERRRAWFSLAEAAGLVDEPDLGRVIARFAPPAEGRAGPIAADDGDSLPLGRRPGNGAR
jgi:8-oxo-dGTP pyrophosphatase MutT (NUDIX family)